MSTLINDIRYAFRRLQNNPGFTIVAVLTLALCISVNTAMLGVLYRVVLNPLPFPDSERLVRLQVHHQASDRIDKELSPAEYQALEQECDAFTSVAVYVGEIRNFSSVGMPQRAWGTRVSAAFFETLGVLPQIGRAFSGDDYGAGGDNVILISDRLWRERFGATEDVLGQVVLLDRKAVTIVGVMPQSFQFPGSLENYWRPLIWTSNELSEPDDRYLSVLGRTLPGASMTQTRQRLQQLSQGYIEQRAASTDDKISFGASSLLKERIGGAGRILWILFGTVSCVTLIGSANLINLYLTHLGKRRKELVVRKVLGAESRHIFRQWLTESFVLSLAGGLAGVTLSMWFIHLLRIFAPYGLPRAEEITVDPVIVGYGFVMSLLVGMGMSVIPLIHVLRQNGNTDVLKSREGDSNAARPQTRFWLIATQATIATLLLINAGLLWTSFREVLHIDPGFSPDRILTARIVLSQGTDYDEDDGRRAFYRRLTDRAAALPEVAEAGMVNSLPLSEIQFPRPFSIENREILQDAAEDMPLRANYTSVSTNYFHLMGIRILAGRSFEPLDEEGAPVVLINETLARRYFPQGDAIGQRLKLGPGNWRPWMTIVGVTADLRDNGRDAPVEPTFYVPYQQKALATYTMGGMFLVVKTRFDPDAVINSLRSELNALDPGLALANIDTMAGRMNEAVASRRYHSSLMGLFALLALTLAMIGVFGVLSCVVTSRRHEIGVRMALGSSRVDLFRLILKQGLKPVLAGVLCGWAMAWASQNLLAGFLFGISPNDPVTFISVGLLFLVTAIAACLLPAYRAATINPTEALRYE